MSLIPCNREPKQAQRVLFAVTNHGEDAMANSTQRKLNPSTYTGLETDDQIQSDRVTDFSAPARSGSSTAIFVVLALAVAAALGYFYLNDTPVSTTSTPPVATQDAVPPPPVPADPPGQTIQDPAPATPAPVTPAPVAPAPVAPAN